MVFRVHQKNLEVGLVDVGYVECAKHEIIEGYIIKEGSFERLDTVNVAASSLAAERLLHERNRVIGDVRETWNRLVAGAVARERGFKHGPVSGEHEF